MNASGIWRGVLNNKVGNFKFANVEVLSDRDTVRSRTTKWCKSRERLWEVRPRSVEELLRRIELPEYTVAFSRNGYEDIELFKEIEPSDLDYLGIMTPDHRTRILAAVQLLHQLECELVHILFHFQIIFECFSLVPCAIKMFFIIRWRRRR